ncbi:MAG: antA/AntB antirepressor family protein [Cetobacterium sp.]
MNDLINIKNENGINLVSARELHEKLGSKERFSKWFERMVEYGFDIDLDFTPYKNVHPQNKQEIQDYFLKIDMAKQICMLQRSKIGIEIRKYFIECEKQLIKNNEKLNSYMISDPIKRAEAWILEEKERQRLELENKNLNTEVMHKEDVIVTLVKDVTLAEKRQRITQIVRYNSNEYKERYNLLYSEFEKKYHMNLKRRINSDEYKHIKPRIKSKMELIDRGLNMIPELFELTCVLFETDYKEILKKIEQGEL